MTGRSAAPNDRPSTSRSPSSATPRPLSSEAVQRWRLVVSRDPIDPDHQRQQLDWWAATLHGCGLPVVGLGFDPPRPRFVIAAPLAPSIAGERELVDVWLLDRLPRWRVRTALESGMPPAHRLIDLFDAWLGEGPLPGLVVASVYRAELARDVIQRARLDLAARDLLAAGSLPRVRRRGQASVSYDLRPFLDALELVDATADDATPDEGPHVRMTLRHDPERGVGRPDEVMAEIADHLSVTLEPYRLVRERLVLSSDRPDTVTGGKLAGR